MKHFIITTFLICASLLVSCTNPHEKEIKEIEEMQVVLNGIKHSYQSINLEKVIYAKETYEKNMTQIQLYYNPDTVDLKIANLLDFYKGVKKSAKGFEEDYKQIGDRIVFLEKQLDNLKADLENKIDRSDSLATFMKNEHNNIELLQNNIGTILYNYDFIVNVHDTIASKVQSIIIKNVE